MIDKVKTREFWENAAQASTLDDEFAGMLTDGDPYISRLRKQGEETRFLQEFPLHPDMAVLEVGTGGGRWAFFLADYVKEIVAIDFSEHMIRRANLALKQKQAQNLNANIRFEVAELTQFETEKKFDLIYFSGMLQYLSDSEVLDTIVRAKALLNPNGYMVSRDSVQGIQRVVLEGEHTVIYRTAAEYADLFQQHGFRQTYNDVSYPHTRFSTFASKLYRWPLMTFTMAKAIQMLLLKINDLIGDPRFLKKAHHLEALASNGVRDHRFFRYEATD